MVNLKRIFQLPIWEGLKFIRGLHLNEMLIVTTSYLFINFINLKKINIYAMIQEVTIHLFVSLMFKCSIGIALTMHFEYIFKWLGAGIGGRLPVSKFI